MSKKKLIRNLEKDIYCRIQPSPLQGVGVYAIKDIPINTNPFKTPTGNCTTDSYISVSPNELKGVSKKIITLLNDFLGLDKHTNTYSIPKNGLKTLDITYYLNHALICILQKILLSFYQVSINHLLRRVFYA